MDTGSSLSVIGSQDGCGLDSSVVEQVAQVWFESKV